MPDHTMWAITYHRKWARKYHISACAYRDIGMLDTAVYYQRLSAHHSAGVRERMGIEG